MASAPPLPAGFEEVPVAAPSQAASAPSADAEAYRAGLESLINSGADRSTINSYITAHKIDPNAVQGLDEAIATVAKGHRVQIPVQLAMPATAPQPANDVVSQPAQGQPAVDALPEGFEEIPLDQAHQPQSDAPQTYGGEIALGARHLINGLTSIPDALSSVGSLMRGASPDPLLTKSANALLDAAGVPNDANDRDRLIGKIIEGATGGAVTGGEMGVAPVLASTLGGAGAGGGSELARQSGAGPVGQLAAGLAGGLAGGGLVAGAGGAANALARERVATPLAQSFERQGVPALPADVGGTGVRMATSAANTTLGGIPIHEAAQNSINAARAARDRIASSIGNAAADATAGGNAVQSGSRSFLESTQQTAKRLYNAIPIASNKEAVLSNTKQALSDLTAGLKSNPELSAVIEDPRMQRIAAAVQGRTVQVPTGVLDQAGNPIMRDVQQGGQLSWQDLKDFRTYVGEKAGAQALQSDTPQANLKALYGALSEDMRATAQADSPQAYTAFTRANNYWRARQARIENVVTPILGKDLNKTPEAAFRQIESWAADKGSFVRTAQALRTMPQEEADSVRATIFSKLGNVSAGRNNAAGDVFSPSDFLTQWNKLPERTKNVLFPGKEYQKDISDLLAIAEAQKGASQFANTSRTATAMHVAAAGAGFFASPLTGLASIAGQFATGKLLASPAFARWLASSAKKPNPAAQLAHINRLTKIAAANPVIANDVLNLQERLAQSFTAQPVAAQDQGAQQPTTRAPTPDPYGQFPIVANPDKSTWDRRTDGSEKGMGWLGLRQRPDGTVSSEISVGLEVNGKEMDVPVMVPGLTKDEVQWLLTTPVEQIAHKLPRSIAEKASNFAKARIAEGKSPFRGPNEASPIAAVNAAENQQ